MYVCMCIYVCMYVLWSDFSVAYARDLCSLQSFDMVGQQAERLACKTAWFNFFVFPQKSILREDN